MSNRSVYPAPFEEEKRSYFSAQRMIRILIAVTILSAIICVIFSSCAVTPARAQEFTDAQIVNAIYYAEGGAKAQYAYGIRSIPYSTIADARRYCFNTVRNNRKRFVKQTKYSDYLEFLASRYCPVGYDNDKGTNKYWLKNVRFYLKRYI